MKHTTKRICTAAAVATALAMSACFGGGDDDDTTTGSTAGNGVDVPDSADSSTVAFLAFLTTLGASDESSQPLLIGDGFAVPADESNDPQPLI